jgi:hypothetical protein
MKRKKVLKDVIELLKTIRNGTMFNTEYKIGTLILCIIILFAIPFCIIINCYSILINNLTY